MKKLAGLADIPEHTRGHIGQTANALKKRKKDICIYYQDTKPNVWDALKKGLQDEYTLSVSIKTDCLCLQLTPKAGKDDIVHIARCLSNMIAGTVQRVTMEKMITRVQPVDSKDTLEILVMLCMARAAQKGFSQADHIYVKTIERRIIDCLKTHRRMHLEGFMTFRMRDFVNGWAVCVDDVLQYVSAKTEYNAYMEILRRFYRAQPCRCQHAVVQDMLDGGYVISADDCVIRISRHNTHRHMQTAEEELIHVLLQLAPARIEIQLMRNTQQMPVINALQLVFGPTVEIRG